MRGVILGGLLGATLLVASEGDSLDSARFLSPLYQESLKLEYEKNHHDSSRLLWQWVSPWRVGASEMRRYDGAIESKNRAFSVSVNQPLFRSGAIYQSIRYARLSERYGEAEIKLRERELVLGVIETILQLRQLDHRLEKQRLLVENAALEVERKREQFGAGLLDSGTLDRALLEHHSAEVAELGLLEQRQEALQRLKNSSALEDYQGAELPHFELLERETYLGENLHLERARLQRERLGAKYREVGAGFLPQISLVAEYAHERPESNGISRGWNDYKSVGLQISMPLDFTTLHQVQSARIAHLRSGVEERIAREQEENLYAKTRRLLDILSQKEGIARQEESLYGALLEDALAREEVGELTPYDVQTMRNSKAIKALDLKLHALERQRLLLKLYAHAKGGA